MIFRGLVAQLGWSVRLIKPSEIERSCVRITSGPLPLLVLIYGPLLILYHGDILRKH